ncbi:helix-hairpin-helix domain-containing protein [Ancylomarina sp. 16SWW S1-10-2]|uniref:ComEA family DNA-binding protein n=1 Tax=Ancylomarina sp. 16SWW S1-10-2 TaxID=2499681 RepID=UPI0012ADB81E|nr:helix-hairpin-helix domain-containing protein [Ancylomarina sp. 16SWW S1-10-2]MRT91590.1 helix-hairpin-helix domain-containing protein [Ancylomarina sp. 16SWW S1-10-2]
MFRFKAFIILLIITLFSSANLLGQNTASKNDIIERIIENIAENSDEELDYTDLVEKFNELFDNPINLNKASKEDLEELHLLSDYQIQNLIEYRKESGLIYSLYELRFLDGFSYSILQEISPFVNIQIDSQKIKPSQKSRAKHFILIRSQRTLENEEGYKSYNFEDESPTSSEDPAQYMGKEWKYYTRYKYSSPKKDIEFGFTAENDAGEPFFKDVNSEGFDFYSAFAEYTGKGKIRQINIGDYHLKFGQGLSLWSGLASRKSTFTTQNAKRQQGIKSYHSTDENLFFRGAAIRIDPIKNISLTAFSSFKKRDANIENNLTQSINNSGLHRTENEIQKKDKLDEKAWGGTLLFKLDQIEFGTSFIKSHFSPELISKTDDITKIYDFSGDGNYNLSAYYETRYNKIHLYGEIAKSQSGGKAILQGLNLQPHPQLSLEVIYRKYDKNYQALYGNAFGEQSGTQNEEGFYFGAEFHPYPKWTILAYYDLYEFPWLKYRVSSPTTGRDYLCQIEYNPTKEVSIYFRYKDEKKPENSNDEIIKTPIDVSKKQYRLHLSAKLNENWEIRNRLELSEYNKTAKESGYLVYQDIIYKHSRLPFTTSIRYALFDTDSYNTRIYAYENDILYAFSIPPYFNKGSRFYLNFRYKFNRSASLYLRYARTQYANSKIIGSGNAEISGDTKSEIKLQLKLSF